MPPPKRSEVTAGNEPHGVGVNWREVRHAVLVAERSAHDEVHPPGGPRFKHGAVWGRWAFNVGTGAAMLCNRKGAERCAKEQFEKVVAAAAAATNMNSSLPVSIVPLTEPVG